VRNYKLHATGTVGRSHPRAAWQRGSVRSVDYTNNIRRNAADREREREKERKRGKGAGRDMLIE